MTPIVGFAADVLGFRLHPQQAAIIEAIYTEGVRTTVLRLGRRSGKGRIAAVVATYEATVNAEAHLRAVPPGEQVSIVIVATRQDQARVVHKYLVGFLKRPALAALVVKETADEVVLSNGISIVTMPAHAAAVRGIAAAVVILDEAAWFNGVDGSPLDVAELWRALVPATAQFPQGRVLVLSTPRWSTGWFADLCAQAASGEFADMRHWHASTAEMNPSVPASFLERERLADPVAFAREYEAEFVAGIGAALDPELVRAAVRDGHEHLPPVEGRTYLIAVDPAYTGDTFAVIVGHREPDTRVVVDHITSWKGSKAAPVDVDGTLDAIATLSAVYHGARVVTDNFSAESIRQGLERRGVPVDARPWDNTNKMEALTVLRRVLYAGRLSIPRHRDLIAELVSLEQRPTPSGRPRIAAPGRSHDDFASALLALVADLGAESPEPAGLSIPPELVEVGLFKRRRSLAYAATRPRPDGARW